MQQYRIGGNFRMSNFRTTAKGNISNGFIFEFSGRPPHENCVVFDALKNVLYRVMVRGYNMYRRVWEASVGKELTCQRVRGNLVDPFNHAGNFRTGFIFV